MAKYSLTQKGSLDNISLFQLIIGHLHQTLILQPTESRSLSKCLVMTSVAVKSRGGKVVSSIPASGPW
jgi:hypothetical protein